MSETLRIERMIDVLHDVIVGPTILYSLDELRRRIRTVIGDFRETDFQAAIRQSVDNGTLEFVGTRIRYKRSVLAT